MNRRAFFATLAAGLAAVADPERLLWVPGRKLISIPARSVELKFSPGYEEELYVLSMRYIAPALRAYEEHLLAGLFPAGYFQSRNL